MRGEESSKRSFAAFGRRPWVGARQGRRQKEGKASPPGRDGAVGLGERSSGHGTPLRLGGAVR